MQKMAIARRRGEVHWPKEWQRTRDARWHSRTNLRRIAARGFRWGSQRIGGGSSHGAAKRIGDESSRGARAIGAKRIDKLSRGPKNIGDKSSQWHSPKNLQRIVARGVRNRGQQNRQNVARAERIYDINRRWGRARWRPKEYTI